MKRIAVVILALVLSMCGGGEVIQEESAPTNNVELGITGGDSANNAFYGVDISMWEGPMSEYEMDCFWDAGVRHLIVGTQIEEIARQQLDMARRRGMSLDAYVFLHWNEDMASQLQTAFQRVAGFTVGRMWIDVEEQAPAGMSASALADKVQQAVNACRTQTAAECGIYTGGWFWMGSMGNTTRFSDLPVWYARYNYKTSLSDWSTEHFGGWSVPAGKQWGMGLCGVGGADLDTIQRRIGPDLVVDHTAPPAPTAAPAAPVNLFPANSQQWQITSSNTKYIRLMADTLSGATTYEFALEAWNGSKWSAYATWSSSKPFMKVFPSWENWIYRFQVRAKNAYGWGPLSNWSEFEYGTYSGSFPADWGVAPPPPSGPDAGVSPPADAGTPPPDAGVPADAGTPSPGAPVGLSPNGSQGYAAGSAVALTCAQVSSATSYQFVIEYVVNGTWHDYYTYAPTDGRQTFWPQMATSYRWRAAALIKGTLTPWSDYASFTVK